MKNQSYSTAWAIKSRAILIKKLFLFLLIFASFTSYAQLEGFESGIPTSWKVMTGSNGLGDSEVWKTITSSNSNLPPYEGAQSAFVNNWNIGINNTEEDWLIMNRRTVPANGELRFFVRQTISGNQSTLLQIRVSTNAIQDNQTAYSTVVSLNETQLNNNDFHIYKENTIDLSAYANQQVYIAFVRVHTQITPARGGERFVIDNVNVVPACVTPVASAPEATVLSNTAALKWTLSTGVTSFEIEVLPANESFTGLDAINVTVNPSPPNQYTYVKTGLSEETVYKYRVRTRCADGQGNIYNSVWSDEVIFITKEKGIECSNPIIVDNLPYHRYNSTGSFNYHNTSQGSSCGAVPSTTNYLAGPDLFFKYTATATESINITMTPTSTVANTSLFVYTSCANIGVSCIAGVANTGTAVRNLNLSVVAGQSYIIVVSSSVNLGFQFNLLIQRQACSPKPATITASAITTDTAKLTWTKGTFTQWQVAIQSTHTSLPPSTGILYTVNDPTVSNLTPGTMYQTWVRAICSAGVYGAWAGPYYFATNSCAPADKCNFTFTLRDDEFDGWDTNRIKVRQNGIDIATLGTTIASGGGPVNVTVALCNGIPFELVWGTKSNTYREISVEVKNSSGKIVYDTRNIPEALASSSSIHTGIVDCTGTVCGVPYALKYDYLFQKLLWSSSGGTVTSWGIYPVQHGNPAPDATTEPLYVTTSTSFEIPLTLSLGAVYTFYVRAICANGSSEWVASSPYQAPNSNYCHPPRNLTATHANPTTVNLSWTGMGNESSWTVRLYYNDPGNMNSPILETTTVANSITIPDLDPNIGYTLSVMASCGSQSLAASINIRHPSSVPCASASNGSNHVKALVIKLINKVLENGIVEGSNTPELQALAPYILHANPRLYSTGGSQGSMMFVPRGTNENHSGVNFDIQFRKFTGFTGAKIIDLDISSYHSAENLMSKIIATWSNGQQSRVDMRHINFCPGPIPSCTLSNPNSAVVNGLMMNLIKSLIAEKMNGATDQDINNSNPDALKALRPFITQSGNVRIHNFISDFDTDGKLNLISFSFSTDSTSDIRIVGNLQALLYSNFQPNLSEYVSSRELLSLKEVFIEEGKEITIDDFEVRQIDFCPSELPCSYNNPHPNKASGFLGNLILHLIQQKHNGLSDADINNTDSAEMRALRPYVTDSNAKVHNFISEFDGNKVTSIRFSFGNDHENDVVMSGNLSDLLTGTPLTLDVGEYISPDRRLDLTGEYEGRNPVKIAPFIVQHIDFCGEFLSCSDTNPKAATVKALFIALLNHLKREVENGATIPDGYTCNELQALSPYITDTNPGIFNFNPSSFSFSFHPTKKQGDFDVSLGQILSSSPIAFISLGDYITHEDLVTFVVTLRDGTELARARVRHVDFCPPLPCTSDSPVTGSIKALTLNLLNKLRQFQTGQVPDGYVCAELQALAPYIEDYKPYDVIPYPVIGIYGFTNNSGVMSFSFGLHKGDPDMVIELANFPITDFDLINYNDPTITFQAPIKLSNGKVHKDSYMTHIDFCPAELYCVKHIAIVVDESGSITNEEAAKIKMQLTEFIKQQANTNVTRGANIHISLIGMSDRDFDNRTDHVLIVKPNGLSVTMNRFTNWINKYLRSYGTIGVSPSSDYWNSGLKRALDLSPQPKFVLMITDGSQTSDDAVLKETMSRFNNHSPGPDKPHLYVFGIEKGHYVNMSTVQDLPKSKDPNYTIQAENSGVNVTQFLGKSLKFLFNLGTAQFPNASVLEFNKDYFGHDNFNLLSEDNRYFSDKISDAGIVCSQAIEKDFCDDCVSFQPEPGKEYMLSAWVKEESKVPMRTYTHPAINIVFFYDKKAEDVHVIQPSARFVPSGNIIDGWQRISGSFIIPKNTNNWQLNTVTIGIELENSSVSVPVYFDDIRIHPMDGSMKSFVYDPMTFKLMSELDENNYSTFYEYDNEGGLVRVKKETEKGVKTIQETRSGNVINTQGE